MLIIPQTYTMEGLVFTYGLKGVASASSTNLDSDRVENPLLYNENDRWCGKNTSIPSDYWMVFFPHNFIYLTNYSIKNAQNHPLISWRLEATNTFKRRGWTTISTVTNSQIPVNSFSTFLVNDSGPFNQFRFVTMENSYYNIFNEYHFCIHKVDFFGAAFTNLFSLPQRNHIIPTKRCFFLFLLC